MDPLNKATSPRIAAIILAAGSSRRMGAAKLLLPLGDRPIVAHVVDAVLAAGSISPVVVVTGHAAEGIAGAMRGRDVRFVHNADYAAGEMLSSVKAGAVAMGDCGAFFCEAFFIVLGDQPGIQPATFQRLIDAWRAASPRVVTPSFNGRRGHPILLSAGGIDEILTLPPDATLKTYIARHKTDSIEVEVNDAAVLADIDTPEQYQQLLSSLPRDPK